MDEGAVAVGILRGEFHHIARAGETDGLAFVGGEIGHRIDRLVIVLRAPAADGIVVFQAEAERIDRGMAAHAVGVLRQLRDLLPHGERAIELRVLKRHGHGRRLERHAHDGAREKDAAMNGRGALAVGKGREQVGMRDHAGALLGIEVNALETLADVVLCRKACRGAR